MTARVTRFIAMIERSRFPRSPRLRPYNTILLKLGVGTTHGPEPLPAPKLPGLRGKL